MRRMRLSRSRAPHSVRSAVSVRVCARGLHKNIKYNITKNTNIYFLTLSRVQITFFLSNGTPIITIQHTAILLRIGIYCYALNYYLC